MKRPETKNYKTISGAGAYDYISDVNQYFNYLEGKLNDINVLSDVRQAFADYYQSEGCSCCQNVEAHEKAENKLGELLASEKYKDDSGFDWYKYTTKD